jgi:hypothetical protein
MFMLRSSTTLVSAGAVAIGLGLGAASAHAVSIGVNYTGAGSYGQTQAEATGGYSLAPTATAGYATVAQDNWNNTTTSYTDGNGYGNVGVLSTVVDSTGATVSGMSVATAPDTSGIGKEYPTSGTANWGFSGNNLTMLEGNIRPSPQVTVSGIPYSQYDVYVYLSAPGGNGGYGAVTISANSGLGAVGPTNEYYYNYAWPNGAFIQATATSVGAVNTSSSPASNYVLFTGNTASGITLALDNNGWNTGLAAFQVVDTATPEPASLGLLVLGGLGVLLLKRRGTTSGGY